MLQIPHANAGTRHQYRLPLSIHQRIPHEKIARDEEKQGNHHKPDLHHQKREPVIRNVVLMPAAPGPRHR